MKNLCEKCGHELKCGKFAYRQKMCFLCYSNIALQIAEKHEGLEKEIILDMLENIAYIHSEKRGFATIEPT